MAYSVRIRVRYNECDLQGVVFNANYLVYVDETLDRWVTDLLGQDSFDMMVKKATVEWQSSARWGDQLELVPEVVRWGTSSFDMRVSGSVDGRPVFVATLVYINVIPGTHTPSPVPEHIRAGLGGPGSDRPA